MSTPFLVRRTPLVERLWSEQKGQCALCNHPMLSNRFEAPHASVWSKHRATIDHIIPRSKGGLDAPQNLQLAHARCNKIKGDRL